MSAAPVALLTHGDHYGSLAAARCLGDAGVRVVFAEHRALAPARWSRFVAERVAAPPVHELTAFGDWLVSFGRQRPGAFLCPTSDDLCFILATRRDELAQVFRLPTCARSAPCELLDKQRLAEHARRAGLHTPRTWFFDGGGALAGAAELRFPVLLKPRTQMGFVSRAKGALVRDPERLADALADYRATQRYRDELLAWQPGLEWPMAQAYHASALDGILSVAGYVGADDASTVMLASVKVFQWPRRLGIGVGFEARPVPEDVARGLVKLCRDVGYAGVFEAEFLVDGADGARLFIDFNPRFYGQMGFEIARGARLPLMALHEALGDHATVVELARQAREQSARPVPVTPRYAQHWVLRLLLATQTLGGRMTRAEAARWRAWIASGDGQRTDALFGWGDPLPACLDVATHVGRFARHPRDFVRKFFLDA